MTDSPARYLLRIDDLCPTVAAERWQQCRSLIEEFRLQPILAVVPKNRDPELEFSPQDGQFWAQLRSLEATGATIGLHGYQHRCLSYGRSLLGLHRASEFAGVSARIQREWIHEGLRILRGHGLSPRIFVAPRHGFDIHTLHALRAENMQLLSDGFARRPILREQVVWIPQQLWAPLAKPDGLWTICIHPNTASDKDLAQLRSFLRRHATQFTSVDRVLADSPATKPRFAERILSEISLCCIKVARAARRIARSPLRARSFI